MMKMNKMRVFSLFIAVLMLAGIVSMGLASAIAPATGVKVGDIVYEDVRAGDTIRYIVNLTATEKFTGIKAEITYDKTKLTVIKKDSDEVLSNLQGKGRVNLNFKENDGKIVFAAAGDGKDKNKYDFRGEESLVTLEFKVKDATYSEIGFSVVDMDIDGTLDGRWYFYNYEPVVTEGISITPYLLLADRPETVPTDESATHETATQETTTEKPTEPEDDVPSKGINVGGNVYYIADEGESVLYRIRLKAAALFDGFEAIITYDSEKIEPAVLYIDGAPVTDESAEGRWLCPNLGNPQANSQVDGVIKISDEFPKGNDFTEEKILVEIEFVVKDSAYSVLRSAVNEMTIKDREDAYFAQGIAQITDGIEMREELSVGKKPLLKPSVPDAEPATDDEPAPQEPATDKTEENTTEETSTDMTQESTTQESSADITENSTGEASEDMTEDTRPQTTTASENLSDPTNFSFVYIVGDANSDGKVNVKDATTIQKFAASLVTFDDVQSLAADCDENNQVNVRDATAIQKFAAGIATGLPIAEGKTKPIN